MTTDLNTTVASVELIRAEIAGDLACRLGPDQLALLYAHLDEMVDEAEGLVALIREWLGPEIAPTTIAGKIVLMTQLGTGFHRTARDIIAAAQRKAARATVKGSAQAAAE